MKKKEETTKKNIKKPLLKKRAEKKKTQEGRKSGPEKILKKEEIKEPHYIEAIGRRKKAIANIKIFSKTDEEKEFLVNKKNIKIYFPDFELRKIVLAPFKKTNSNFQKEKRMEAFVKGGGKKGQAEAIRLGISRALIKIDPDLKKILKTQGYLTCDSRIKERKKFGLKKARKAPQWSKR